MKIVPNFKLTKGRITYDVFERHHLNRMKKISVFFYILFLFACSPGAKPEQNKTTRLIPTSIEFLENSHNFGALEAGEIVVYAFEFINNGDTDYQIESVDCTCACVQAYFSKQLVKPGEKGRIEIEFDTAGLTGREYKTIEINGNSNELKHLAIFAEVKNELLEIKY